MEIIENIKSKRTRKPKVMITISENEVLEVKPKSPPKSPPEKKEKPMRKRSSYNEFLSSEFKKTDEYKGLNSKEKMKMIAEKWQQHKNNKN